MGRDKRLLRLAGTTLVERNLAFLARLFPVVALSVRDAGQAPWPLPPGVEIVTDSTPGSPLGGISALLARYHEPVFVLAADVAFPSEKAVQRLLDACYQADVTLPVAGDHLEPLHAVYGPRCLPHAERLLACDTHSILDLLPEVRVMKVPFDDISPFLNVNTPEDWAQVLDLAGEDPGEEADTGSNGRVGAKGSDASATTTVTASPENAAVSAPPPPCDQVRTGERAVAGPEREEAPRHRPAVLCIIGRSGSGKTTLIEHLIPEFKALGLRVAAAKRVARLDIDTPGKDSWRHATAGAEAYAVASASQLAYVTRLAAETTLDAVVGGYFTRYDVVICEGYRREAPHVVEVFRSAAGHSHPICEPGQALALVTDADLSHKPRFGFDDAAQLAQYLADALGLRQVNRTADPDRPGFRDTASSRTIWSMGTAEAGRQENAGAGVQAGQPGRAAQPALVAIVGKSNAGKTTLIEKVVPELVKLGLRVGTVKHDAHSFEIDHRGKDSWRHGQAGAEAYVVASPERLAFITKLDGEVELVDIARTYFGGFDLVVAEGYKRTAPYRVELFRIGAGHTEPLCAPGEAIALVTDAAFAHEHRFGLEDAFGLASFIASRLGALRTY